MNTRCIHLFAVLALACVILPNAGCPGPTSPSRALAVKDVPRDTRILFLHHSTGENVWNGGVPEWFDAYNAAHKTRYTVRQQAFPKDSPYGWENFPYDYWNIWVQHSGPTKYRDEPTLEILAKEYDLIVFKHCFPVSNIDADTGQADVTSGDKRQENYKLQYAALKQKMKTFPKVKFLVWTGAALVSAETDEQSARRAKEFFDWVRRDWDENGDNIFIWDFRELETEGGLYLKPGYASGDSHPNEEFCKKVTPLFGQRIVDVIAGRGDTGNTTGKWDDAVPPPTPRESSAAPTVVEGPKPEPEPAPILETGAVFDDAETPARRAALWGDAVTYAEDDGANVIRLNFASAPEEDWGEYGKQRVVFSRPPQKNLDLRPYRYLAMHMKADREMEVVLSLVTLPDPAGPRDQEHFRFSAYLHSKQRAWKTVTLDLNRLELAVEGEAAYAKAGQPTRPNELSLLKICTSAKNADAVFALDDISFHATLPESLRGTVLEP